MKNAPDVEDIIARAEKEMDDDAESIITNERYSFIGSIIGDCLKKNKIQELTTSDKIEPYRNKQMACTSNLCSSYVACILCVCNNSRFHIDRLDK